MIATLPFAGRVVRVTVTGSEKPLSLASTSTLTAVSINVDATSGTADAPAGATYWKVM